jgi:hypothetical protein
MKMNRRNLIQYLLMLLGCVRIPLLHAAVNRVRYIQYATLITGLPTTTIDAEVGHNTSANPAYNKSNFAANFTGTSSVTQAGATIATDTNKTDDSLNPITPGHVSPTSVKTAVANFNGKHYTHWTPWFRLGGGGGHVDIGLNCDSLAWVLSAMQDIERRGFDGFNIDWYGSGSYEDSVTTIVKGKIAQTPSLTYAIMIDSGSYTTTAELQAHLTYIKANYLSDPNYQTQGGKPVVMFFGPGDTPGVDYAGVKAATGIPMYWQFQGPNVLSQAFADGCFDWVHPYKTGVDVSDPYNAASANSYLTSVHSSAKGSMPCISPRFNGTLTKKVSWSEGKMMPGDSGKCLLSQASVVNANIPVNCIGILWATWDDWEEGSAIESGVENNIVITEKIAGQVVSWTVAGGTGDESTIHAYKILASADGVNATVLTTILRGNAKAFDLSTISGWTMPYTIYVVAVGEANIRSHISNGVLYTGPPSAPTSLTLGTIQ